jgi:transcription-repair coupling factor (superfamily II helicase)
MVKTTGEIFARVRATPAVQALSQRMERGGVVPLIGVASSAQPFLAVLCKTLFPNRLVLVIAEGLKTQETFEQDIATWLQIECDGKAGDANPPSPLFFPEWQTLPHDSRLPHVDVISDRLHTLTELATGAALGGAGVVVTSVQAVQQRTFAREVLAARTRVLARGERHDPLDLVEWLEDQGYEPEAQVSQKGEIALRGGILDVFPLASPWPVRLEFFGDELESLRYFDPLSQISREEIARVTLSPAGELGILKHAKAADSPEAVSSGTLLDYLPADTIILACDPALLQERAEEYAAQVPEGDRLHYSWNAFQSDATARSCVLVTASEEWLDTPAGLPSEDGAAESELPPGLFRSLDAFRPLTDRAPEPQVAEDAEIFGRYKVQRPRRLKSAHAQAVRSALDIDFADLDDGDYVVHLQHGIGRYLGLAVLPAGAGTRPTDAASPPNNPARNAWSSSMRRAIPPSRPPSLCAGHRSAPGQQICRHRQSPPAAQHPGRHPLGQGQGAGRAGRARCRQRTARHPGGARIAAGHPFSPDTPWQREFESAFIYEETPDQCAPSRKPRPTWNSPSPWTG